VKIAICWHNLNYLTDLACSDKTLFIGPWLKIILRWDEDDDDDDDDDDGSGSNGKDNEMQPLAVEII